MASITFIHRAGSFGRFALQAPMDYPPDWMLIDLHKKQDVNEKYFPALALYYLRYLEEYEKNGVHIDYLSLFNEPGVYTKIRYTKIRDLLKNHVGPLLKKSGVKTRLQLSEAPTRENAANNYPVVLDDPAARKYVANAPYHGYDFKNFDRLAALMKRYPGLPFWMTEICWAYEAGAPRNIKLPRYDYEDGDFWANQIFSDLEAGASAWIYWNMILNENGRPMDGFSHSRRPGPEHTAARGSDKPQDPQGGLHGRVLLSGTLQQVRASGRCACCDPGLCGEGSRAGISHPGGRLRTPASQQPQRSGRRHSGLA